MTKHLTPGEKALREAARLETARVYGGLVPGTKTLQPVSVTAAVAEAELRAAKPEPRAELCSAVTAGLSNSQIIAEFDATYAEVRAARKHVMRGAA